MARERPQHGAGSPSRAVAARVIGAFVAVLLGLAAINALVVGLIWPQLSQLSSIGDDHARAVAAATRLHRELSEIRRATSHPDSGRAARSTVDVTAAFRRIDEGTAKLAPLAGSDEERAALGDLRAALGGAEAAALGTAPGPSGNGPGRARPDLEAFAVHAGRASAAVDTLVFHHARDVQRAALAVRRALVLAMLAASVLTALVIGAALLLLRYAVAGVRSHAAALEQRSEDMAAFASRAAHEIRNPLQGLGLALELLRRNPGSTEVLARAQTSARRLGDTVDGLLEFSRSGGVPRPGDRCAVSAVVEEVTADLAHRLAERDARLERDVEGEVAVEMAAAHLRTVLLNLIGNALRYGCEAPGRMVSIRATAGRDRAFVSVSDTGAGIPRDALPHVFEPLYRASSEPGGYGLGLATVKRLVEAHGGEVTISSEEGRGTTVTVALPRADPAAVAAGAARAGGEIASSG